MHLISPEGYKNAGVHILTTKKTGEIWMSMKNVHNGLVVKNMSDLVLKQYKVFIKPKTLQNSKLGNIK